jgi:hypothetical protein
MPGEKLPDPATRGVPRAEPFLFRPWPADTSVLAPVQPPAVLPTEAFGAVEENRILRHGVPWFEVFGYGGAHLFYAGNRVAPSGFVYNPLATLDLDFNVSLLPEKRLYLWALSNFWAQRATAGQTHGVWDYTKREYDLTVGGAYFWESGFEARIFGYALSNLNRGVSNTVPQNYCDGFGVEARYYLPGVDIYDVSRLGFLSIGYLPSKTLIGGNGDDFRPGFFARAYLTCDLNVMHSYVYCDTQLTCESAILARLIFLDAGVATRPFESLPGLELRAGGTDTLDVQVNNNRGLGYFAVRLLF